MSRIKGGLLLLVWILMLAPRLWALADASLAQPLEADEGSARSEALGSAFVGLADDSTALLTNPAGLATLDSAELSLDNDSWLVGTYQEQGLLALPFGRAGTLGLGVDYMDFGSFPGRDAEGNPTAAVTAGQSDFRAAYGVQLLSGLSLGLGLHAGYETLANVSQVSEAADLGLLWEILPGLRLGLAALDLGPSVEGSPQDSTVNGGVSYILDLGHGAGWLGTVEASIEPQAVNSLRAGIEAWIFGHVLTARAGYELDLADEQLGGVSGLTVGLGLRYAALQVDYSYLPYGALGASQRLDFSYAWPAHVMESAVRSSPLSVAAGTAPAAVSGTGAADANALQLQFTLPGDPYDQGQTLEEEGKPYEALKAYQEAVKQDAADVRAWRALGSLYYKLGQTASALQCFEQVLVLKPDDPALRRWVEQAQKNQPGP